MVGFSPDELMLQFAPVFKQLVGMSYIILSLIFGAGVIIYMISFLRFNVAIQVFERTKDGRTIIKFTKGVEVKDKKSGIVYLMFKSPTLFFGKKITCPPSNCIFPYKSIMAKKLYALVYSDGQYLPVPNFIAGKKNIVTDEGGNQIEGYSWEGTGLEIARDFDFEQSIINTMAIKADKYKNQKPIEIIAMYALMIIVIISAATIIIYSLKRVGDLFETMNIMTKAYEAGVQAAVTQNIGTAP